MSYITSVPQGTNKVAVKQRARIKLARKLDRILRNYPLGTNPLHHHPNFNGSSYHYGDLASDFNLTRAQVAKIDTAAHKTSSKKEFAIRVARALNIDPTLIDSRW